VIKYDGHAVFFAVEELLVKFFSTIINPCTILAQLAELIVHNRSKAVSVCVCLSVCMCFCLSVC